MSTIINSLITVCLIGLLTSAAHSTSLSDTTKVKSDVSFRISNRELTEAAKLQLNRFAESVNSVLSNDTLVSVTVAVSSSPDGPEDLNLRLSQERATAVRDYFSNCANLPVDLFSLVARGEDWELFESLVKSDLNLPLRNSVLDIVASSHTPQQKEKLLRQLGKGRVWKYLSDNIFPKVRVAEVNVEYKYSEPNHLVVTPTGDNITEAESGYSKEIDTVATVSDLIVSQPAMETAAATTQSWGRHAYVKTNLPAWAMLWINAAGEIDLAPHWSANLSIYYAGYNYFCSDVKFRNFTVMPEARYWPRGTNDGFFAGVHFGMAYYNVAFGGDSRYQDHDGRTPALGGGLNVGFRFALPRNNRWKMEFSIGAGVYRLDYDIFSNHHNGLLTGRKKRTFAGIDNAAFSICYTFDIKKKGGVR